MGGASVVAGAPPAAAGHADGPPAGHTGGFGEPTCLACHTEYALNLAGGSLAVEGWPERYRPGETYTLTVVLEVDDMTLAGFQLAVRDDAGAQAGRLLPVGPRVALTDSLGVSYAQHAPGGTEVAGGRIATWTVTWVAPQQAGPLQVNVAANSANGDNSPFGDLIYALSHRAVPADGPLPGPQR